jgi:hypothetical protein
MWPYNRHIKDYKQDYTVHLFANSANRKGSIWLRESPRDSAICESAQNVAMTLPRELQVVKPAARGDAFTSVPSCRARSL